MTVEPAHDAAADTFTIVPVQPGAPAREDLDAPPAVSPVLPTGDRFADPWHLHSQSCYWDVRSCGWVCCP